MNGLSASIRWAFNFKDWKPSKEEWKLALQCVQEVERDRINKFVFAKDAKASMIGQLLMRKAASESCNVPYSKIIFLRTESGKPFISNYKEIFGKLNYNFNISHHGSYCVLAAEHGANIGVDVMKIEYTGGRTILEFFNLMKKQFSPVEWTYINLPGMEREKLERFFRLWCLKESYVKAKGTGIAYSLKNLSFSCTSPKLKQDVILDDTKLFIEGKFASDWTFHEQLLDPDHCVAVAIENVKLKETKNISEHSNPLAFTQLTFKELMQNAVPFEPYDEHFWLTFTAKSETPT